MTQEDVVSYILAPNFWTFRFILLTRPDSQVECAQLEPLKLPQTLDP